MTSLVLLSGDAPGGGLVGTRVSLRDRLVARVWPDRLDRELAAGVAPEASAGLALRAATLIGPAERRSLARRLLGVLRDVRTRHAWTIAQVEPDRRQVLVAAEALETLAERLLDPAPVDARGVARAEVLLRDGTGPLYSRHAEESLAAAAASALGGLEPRRPLAHSPNGHGGAGADG
jgi:hypothetical protein